MRIVHVIQNLDPAWGGVPMVATRVAAAQAGLGHDVLIACHHAPDGINAEAKLLDGLPHRDRFMIAHIPRPRGLARYFPNDLIKDLDPILFTADALHLHGLWDPILLAASKIARRDNVPYAMTPHGMLHPWSLSQKRLKKQIALLLGYRDMLHNAAFLQAMNTEEEAAFTPLNLKASTRIIPNGIFTEEFAELPQPGTFRANHPELADHPYILFLSRLHYKKGLDILGEAFSILAQQHPTARLVVAGPEADAAEPFRKTIAKHQLTDRVLMTGPLYGIDKLAAFIDAACFCLPSRQEGFSIAITEALALAKPVVITHECNFSDVAEINAGVVTSLNPQDVAAAMSQILADPAEAHEMGQRGRDLVNNRYTWPRIAQLCIDAIDPR
ncbi:MAG: glycosyltransferase [Phycisphaeraceae bacterium]